MKRLFLAVFLVGTCLSNAAGQATPQQEFFEMKIRPVLSQQCYACHTDDKMGDCALIQKKASRRSSFRAIQRTVC